MTFLCHVSFRKRSGRAISAVVKGFSALLIALIAASFMGVQAQAAPAPAPAASAPRLTFGVQPGTRTGPDSTRANLSYSATPGARMNDYIVIRNYADASVTLQTYASDAFNGPTGTYDVLRRTTKSKDLGAWVKLDRSSVTIKGRSLVVIPFRIQLPAGVEPGDHDAGIVAAIVTQQLRANGSKVSVEERVGARVHVRVSGALHPQLVVRKLKTSYHGTLNPLGSGSATVTYEIANTGNVTFSATQELQLHSTLGGGADVPKLAAIPELLPGNAIHQQVAVAGVWPGVRLKATVVLVPAPSPQFPLPTLAPVRASGSSWAMPWTLLLLIVLVALLTYLYIRRRRREPAPKASTSGRPTPKRELVSAGARAKPVVPAQPAAHEPDDEIDLRDPPPMKVDLRNPFAKTPIDVSDGTVTKPTGKS
jgi:hypothetical protein